MALQTSGQISLNDIHREAGGPSGGNASINDADIRGMINKASGATSGFNEFYGASSGIPFVIDEGFQFFGSGGNFGYNTYGYGSISGAGSSHRGAAVYQIITGSFTIKGTTSYLLTIRIAGNRAANWFQTVTIGAYTYSYTEFSTYFSGSTVWQKSINANQMMNGSGNTSGKWT